MKVKDTYDNSPFPWFKSMSSVNDRENEDLQMDIYQDYEDDEVDNEPEEEKVKGEENEEDESEKEELEEASEKEDLDEEADKRYWEAKAEEGVHKVCRVISEAVKTLTNLQPKKKSQATRDIRLVFQHDARLVDGVVKAGAYCCWCL